MKNILFIPLLAILIIPTQIFAHVDLEFPIGGEEFSTGDTITIIWQESQTHNTMGWNLHFSPDGGDTWEVIQNGIAYAHRTHEWIVPSMNTSDAQIRVVQDNEGTDYEDMSGRFTINSSTSAIQSGSVSISKLYPNPVADALTINYSVKKSSNISIEMVRPDGKVVEVMVDEQKLPGVYQIVWKRKDNLAGLYFLVVRSGDGFFVRKLVIR